MAKSPTTYRPKDRINHGVFGTGTIEQVTPRYTTIVFDEGGVRKFITEMVELEPSDTEAPKRVVRKAKPKAKAKAKTKPKAKAKAKAKAKPKEES